MALRKAKPFTFKPHGVSDTVDATNASRGAMASLSNLIPNPSTDNSWVPRPAAARLTNFAGFTTPGFVSALLVVGDIAYGMIASARNANKDEPFAYNLKTQTFLPVAGIMLANTPTSPAALGDWAPPIMTVIGQRIVVTHPGFAGGVGGFFFGWFDISGFVDPVQTGTTHSTTVIDGLSTNVLQAGWQVGMTIAGTNIPAGATIVSIAPTGLSVVISVAATDSVALKSLLVSGGTTTAPLWGAGNTNGNALSAVPVAVAQMAGRAYYAVGNGVVFSDSGLACQVTNATQALFFNNGLAVTALGALPLSAYTGGVIQAIICFQGISAMQQITGDPTTNNLATNLIKSSTGTLAPLSVTNITAGIAFISPEGLRVLNYAMQVSDPIGDAGKGISIPFIYALNPSRICAAATSDTLRITTINGFVSDTPTQEWWLDLTRKVWTGPHSFPASLVQAWRGTFVVAPSGITASLWQSDAAPGPTSSYVENGTNLSWTYATSLLPDSDDMMMHAIVEMTLAANYPPQAQVTVTIQDELGTILDTIFMAGSGAAPTSWGSFTWGGAPWRGGTGVMKQRQIAPHLPIVFKQGSVQLTGNSLAGLILGNLYLRYQNLNYLLENTL